MGLVVTLACTIRLKLQHQLFQFLQVGFRCRVGCWLAVFVLVTCQFVLCPLFATVLGAHTIEVVTKAGEALASVRVQGHPHVIHGGDATPIGRPAFVPLGVQCQIPVLNIFL